MKKDEELVAQQAVEFWSTICDVEVDILMEMEEVRLHVCFPLFLNWSDRLVFIVRCCQGATPEGLPELHQGSHEVPHPRSHGVPHKAGWCAPQR